MNEWEPNDSDEVLARYQMALSEMIPHNHALGLRVESVAGGVARMRLPYADHLVGNPATGVLAGGPITTLMDSCCGAAVFVKSQAPRPIATLDLRIDYLRPAIPKRDVLAQCECYKLTRHVGFVRGVAYHDDPSEPIASAAGAFMFTEYPRKRGQGQGAGGGER